ncbi:MAG TPA: hypothetical protein GXX21_00580 [Syntrophomonadaceae bacterium]|nr:hypothetical protein [Syntrophomonadaceae bacterium]
MECENLKKCPFYNDKMDIESGLGQLYKRRYCEGDKTQCARYKVFQTLGREFVPVDLYPNMHERAKKIIEQNK